MVLPVGPGAWFSEVEPSGGYPVHVPASSAQGILRNETKFNLSKGSSLKINSFQIPQPPEFYQQKFGN